MTYTIRHLAKSKLRIVTITALTLATQSIAKAQTDAPPPQETSYPAGILVGRTSDSTIPVFLPLRRTDVSLHLTGGVLTSTVEQEFTNTSGHPMEAIYTFPLASQSTVTDMQLRIGNRVIKSVVKEKQEAKKVYEQAKSSGRKAALIEQARPNIFTTSVANFQPGETVKIRLTTLQAAEFSDGVYSITFPMVVGPRYIPLKIPVLDADRITPPLAHPTFDTRHRVRINTTIDGIPVSSITSTTHAIKIRSPRQSDGTHRITLSEKLTIPDCDFNLKVELVKNQTPAISLTRSAQDDLEYGLITLFPPTAALEDGIADNMPRDVLFLIDASGSMSGASIGQAKAGLSACMKMLRPDDHFNIVRFSDTFSSFAPALRPADLTQLEAARGFVDTLQANGGTEMQSALQHTLRIPGRGDTMRIVVFLTDGDVGNENSLMQLLDQQIGTARVFTFGIGSAPNEFLMRKMAELGRGQARFIRSHEDIGTVMADFFQTLDTPVMTDLSFELEDNEGELLDDFSYYPNPLPDVFRARPVQVVAEYPKDLISAVSIRGTIQGKPVEYRYHLQDGKLVQHDSIGKLHGRARINELMLKKLRTQSEEELYDIRQSIIDAALQHQLLSEFTSRVAVETVVKKGPFTNPRKVKVPTMLPRGWNAGSFFPTATSDPALIMIAALLAALSLTLATVRFLRCRTQA